MSLSRKFTVLGLETSCDETAAAVVCGHVPGPGTTLSNIVLSQLEEHAAFGGVVPEIAARAHVEALDNIVERAIGDAQVNPEELDAVAATAGPGLIGAVMVGLTTGKALALAWNKPFVAVNHLEAHALTARLTQGVTFPYLLLLISGGHCQLLSVEDVGKFQLYGTTVDDAVGEAFDKVAKLLAVPYPGGPNLEKLAKEGNPTRFALPCPMVGRPDADFSFSGLKTAVRHIVRSPEFRVNQRVDLAASFQSAVIASLVDRVTVAMRRFRGTAPARDVRTFVIAGGVAANAAIRAALSSLAATEGFKTVFPAPALCTDNAAMVAWAGLEHATAGAFDSLSVSPKPRWPLGPSTRPILEHSS